MSAIASSRADRWLFAAWVVFSAINLFLMFRLPGEETIPFHFVWISLSLVYGLQPWGAARTTAVLVIVCVVTGTALVVHVRSEVIGWEETTEVPLMTAVFLAMVLHVRRRQSAVREAERLAARERDMRDVLRRFVRLASHELRTPVTIARGYAELVSNASDLEQARGDAMVILDELAKLERNGERLLKLTGMDERAMLRLQPVDADALLRTVIQRWRAVARRNWVLHEGAGTITADPERLTAAVDCLLENAVRYTEDGKVVGIEAHPAGDSVRILIFDNGTGISETELPFVFEAFSSGAKGGTGLGLAIVKSIVAAHGGTVNVHSDGGGSLFILRLPVAGPARAEAAPPARDVADALPMETEHA